MWVSTTKDYLQAGIELNLKSPSFQVAKVKDLHHEQVTRVEYLN